MKTCSKCCTFDKKYRDKKRKNKEICIHGILRKSCRECGNPYEIFINEWQNLGLDRKFIIETWKNNPPNFCNALLQYYDIFAPHFARSKKKDDKICLVFRDC